VSEVIPILIGVLLTATVAASTSYYRQIRKATKEYEKAKEAVEDIVLSFNRELRRESERLEVVAFKVEGSLAKSETGLRKIDNVEKRILPVEGQISNLENQKNIFESQLSQINSIAQNNNNLTQTLSGLDVKIKDIESTQENLKVKISGFEEQIQKITSTPHEFTETALPVIPIKRDKALASLTNTEIAVLEMLSAEGSKTAPEIKDRVQLSREHTARLMKKLYEEGYLEREVGKIPFRYTVKKEMEKMLKKPEPNQQA
jgi:chromosome segregation ATPase